MSSREQKPSETRKNIGLPDANTSVREFILGDFDGDGISNIDDPFPFRNDPTSLKPEVSLSNEFLEIEKTLKSACARAKTLEQKLSEQLAGVNVISRTKSISSTIAKLRKRYLDALLDLAGIILLADDKIELESLNKHIESNWPEASKCDYYDVLHPVNPHYRAIHYNIDGVEVQLRTQRQHAIELASHRIYKRIDTLKKDTQASFLSDYNRLSDLATMLDSEKNPIPTLGPVFLEELEKASQIWKTLT